MGSISEQAPAWVPGIADLATSRRTATNHYQAWLHHGDEEIICRTGRCGHPWLAHFRDDEAGGSGCAAHTPDGRLCTCAGFRRGLTYPYPTAEPPTRP